MEQGTQSARITISGMHCGGCANSVRAALASVAGVASASVRFEDGLAVVEYDPAACQPADLVAAVKARQFGAELLA